MRVRRGARRPTRATTAALRANSNSPEAVMTSQSYLCHPALRPLGLTPPHCGPGGGAGHALG